MHFLGRIGCLALLVAGGSLSAAERKGPERFEESIRRFEASDLQAPPPAHPLLFVGSSSFRMWTNLTTAFPNWPVLNRGFGGSTMNDLLHFYDRIVVPYRPRAIAVYEGDNDLANGQPVAEVLRAHATFLNQVARDLPGTTVVLLAVKPSPSRRKLLAAQRELNAGLKELAATSPRVIYADTFSPILGANGEPDPQWFLADRLHLNARGYAQWTPVLTRALTEAEARRDPPNR